jgi:hypothetical protein
VKNGMDKKKKKEAEGAVIVAHAERSRPLVGEKEALKEMCEKASEIDYLAPGPIETVGIAPFKRASVETSAVDPGVETEDVEQCDKKEERGAGPKRRKRNASN